MRQSEKNYKRVVIKIGSSLFYSGKTAFRPSVFNNLVGQITELIRQEKEIVIVSSGAIALGMQRLNLKVRPRELPFLQAAAAVGQNALMDYYTRAFKENSINCAQVLLTWEDFSERKRYLNAKNTLFTLLKLKSVPVINENDTVSTDEIKFGDNDRLSALVSVLINADLLIILSDVAGLLEKDRKTIVRIVPEINSRIHSLACPTDKKTCVGGMVTKIEAAKIAVDSGIPCVIADGQENNIIIHLINNPLAGGVGTVFLPKDRCLAAKKRWIAFGSKPKGKIIVDEGAKLALFNKKSLLCVGITSVEGEFDAGDVVSVRDKENCEFARGRVSLSDKDLDKVKGTRYHKEIIHRDNIVIF